MDPEVAHLRALLDQAKPLCRSDSPFVKVAGERIVTIVIDALTELDLDLADPWDELPAVEAASELR